MPVSATHFPLPPEAPSSAHLITQRTSSSLFKVLEVKADVMPAFLDWTRDWGADNTNGVME